MSLDRIIAHGNRSFDPKRDLRITNKIRCVDGFKMSVIAGEGAYCSPRPDRYGALGDTLTVTSDFDGPYTHVEVGYPSQRPEPWLSEWIDYAENADEPTGTVYGYVPVEMVRALVAAHGGESA